MRMLVAPCLLALGIIGAHAQTEQRAYTYVEPEFSCPGNGSAIRILPPDIPGGYPVKITGANINNEYPWPVVQNPWTLSIDPSGDFAAISGYPAFQAGTAADPSNPLWGLQFQRLKILASIQGGAGRDQIVHQWVHNPPILYRKGDAIIVDVLCGPAVGSTAPVTKALPSWIIKFEAPAPACDAYTKLLLHGGMFTDNAGLNPLPNFVSDSSASWHRADSSTATIDTSTGVVGQPSSIAFNGTNGRVQFLGSYDWIVFGADWTWDFWVKPASTSGSAVQGIVGIGLNQFGPWFIKQVGNQFQLMSSSTGTSWDVAANLSMGTATAGQWTHLAVQRSGGTITTFNDGAVASTASVSGNLNDLPGAPITFGDFNDQYPFAGNLGEVRFSRGIARYSGAFTPPTAPYCQ